MTIKRAVPCIWWGVFPSYDKDVGFYINFWNISAIKIFTNSKPNIEGQYIALHINYVSVLNSLLYMVMYNDFPLYIQGPTA